ncbi:MAG: tetratricopeptide repeat protein [Pseudobutyrivibrio sp.]|nr:tetratricopeptide repeat protein [Pseudobutyrivibrio sp.]
MASSTQIAKEYFDKGMSLIRTNNVELGIDNLNMAKSIYEELKDDTYYILSLRGIAIAYGIIGYDSKMLFKCLNALNYLDKKSIKGAKHYFYTTICNRYILLGDYDSALNYGRMALQDLEDYGTEFDNPPHAYIVACLNLAYIYLHMHRFDDAKTFLDRGMEISKKNDLHHLDLIISALNANLHHNTGDNQYVYDHLEELVGFIKSTDITIQDYIQSLTIIIETFCGMGEFERAEAVAKSLDSTATITNDLKLKMEASKLAMLVYKQWDKEDKYYQACVRYAEDSIREEDAAAAQHLLDMDTAIALSIADTPAELL